MQSTEQVRRPDTASHTIIHRLRVASGDVGTIGIVDGATLLEWIHTAGHAVARQWSGRRCVTAHIGNLHLDRPIRAGELVDLHASVVYTGRTSMHVLVTVYSRDPLRAKTLQTAQCPIIFVALDDDGSPMGVEKWTPVTILDLQRQRQARVRIPMRKRIDAAMAAQSYSAEGTAPRTTARFLAVRTNVTDGNRIHGGRVLRWIEEAARGCGTEWFGGQAITSYVAGVRFHRPVNVSDVIEVTARVIHTGPRSAHISVHVTTTGTDGAHAQSTAHALLVVVSLDQRGNARPVPTWVPLSDEDHRLDQHARHLIELRLFVEPSTMAAELPAYTDPEPLHIAV